MKFNYVSLMALNVLMLSCQNKNSVSYTLYRNSVLNESMRLHVASFDAKDGHDYNMENCEVARGLFQAQPGIKTRFWCEKGSFKE
jgi:hypothetical protein